MPKFSDGRKLMLRQGVLALTVDKLGMSLTRMGKGAEEVRFLDDLDLTLSMDNSTTARQTMTSIEMNCKPIVLRASYRDISLILAITNKATAAYAKQTPSSTPLPDTSSSARSLPSTRPNAMTRFSSRGSRNSSKPLGKAQVSLSSESVSIAGGLRLRASCSFPIAQGFLRRPQGDSHRGLTRAANGLPSKPSLPNRSKGLVWRSVYTSQAPEFPI